MNKKTNERAAIEKSWKEWDRQKEPIIFTPEQTNKTLQSTKIARGKEDIWFK